jgi:hypothetical protein
MRFNPKLQFDPIKQLPPPPNHIMNYLPQSLFRHLVLLEFQEEVQILSDMKQLQWIQSHAVLQVQATSPLPRA